MTDMYVNGWGIQAWDCPDCGRSLHARTRLEWHWDRCRQCQAKANARTVTA